MSCAARRSAWPGRLPVGVIGRREPLADQPGPIIGEYLPQRRTLLAVQRGATSGSGRLQVALLVGEPLRLNDLQPFRSNERLGKPFGQLVIAEHLPPDLVQPVTRLPEEGDLAREAIALEELGHPAVEVDDLDPGRARVQMRRTEGPQIRLDVMGETGREGGQKDPLAGPDRVLCDLVRQIRGPMHHDYRLAGPGPATNLDRPTVVPVGDPALFGVEEDAPAFESLLKEATQLRLAVRNEDGLPALLRLDHLAEGQLSGGRLRFRVPSSANIASNRLQP